MPYPLRLALLGVLASFVAAGCGGAARSTGRGNTGGGGNTQVEDDAGSPSTPPPVDSGPTASPKGSKCSFNSDCQSMICSDGVCCNMDCRGICNSCKVAGNEGTCTPVPDGEDPKNQCPKDAVGTCNRDGMCD